MKSSIKTLFVVLAIVMSFVAVQAVCAKGPEGPDCSTVVFGEVTDLDEDNCTIDVTTSDGEVTTINGISVRFVDIVLEDNVAVNCFVSQEDKYVACYLTIDGGDVIDLRPRAPE